MAYLANRKETVKMSADVHLNNVICFLLNSQ